MDIMLYETGNGGEFSLENGDLVATEGLTNQPYLAHFGGNIESSTTGEETPGTERLDWYGNAFFLNDPEPQLNSELERALANTEVSSKGRIDLERAAAEDMEYLQEYAEVETEAAILSNDKVAISDKLTEPEGENKYLYIWEATKNELIEQKII